MIVASTTNCLDQMTFGNLPHARMLNHPRDYLMTDPEGKPTSTFESIGHSVAAILSSPVVHLPQPEESLPYLQCKYKTNRCQNSRTTKPDGSRHSLCAYHRMKQNQAQAKSDRKRRPFITQRRRERRRRLQLEQLQHQQHSSFWNSNLRHPGSFNRSSSSYSA